MGNEAATKRVRVGGDVQKASIVRGAGVVRFNLVQDSLVLPVVYEGRDPLPDTFKDGAQALAGGRLDSAGVFHAQEIQAKCASKYAPKPGVAPEGLRKQIAPSGSSYKL
jgi:cytochrome c-type biogenesis protein CcmE